MKAYLHTYILCCIYQLDYCFPRKDVRKFRCSIWHHQSTTTSCFQPPSMTPGTTTPASPPSPTATAAHCRHQPPTTTADNQQQNNQQRCGNATSQATTTTSTTRDDKQHLKMNTNDPTTHKRQPAPTNGHKWWRAEVKQPTSPPSNPLIWNPGATSPSAMQQLIDKQQPRFVVRHCCLLLGQPSEYPPPFIPTQLAHTQHNNGPTMWDKDNDGWGEKDTRWGGHGRLR